MVGRIILTGFIFLFITGCASGRFTIDQTPATSLSLDAKQRVVLVTDKGGGESKKRVVCAEPSPDVLTSVVTSGALTGPGKSDPLFKAEGQFTETLARLTNRSATIQLLRDALYRACEGYMNGAIDSGDYKEVILGYDDMVITLLSIEEISQLRRGVISVADETPKTDAKNNLEEIQMRGVGNAAAEIRTIVLNYLANQMKLYEMMEKHSGTELIRGK